MKLADDPRFMMLGVWSFIIALILFFLGYAVIAGMLPPYKPSADAQTIAAIYNDDYTRIRIGNVILMFGAMMWIPSVAVFARILTYIEGGPGMLTYMQIISGTCNTLLFFYPALWWLAASFRPERTPELTLMLNDIAYLQFLGALTVVLPMLLTLTAAAFFDKRELPVIPRWYGYLSAWTVVLLLPGQLIFFVKTGPFAWNGLLAFWLVVVIFSAWWVASFFVMKSAVERHFK